MDQRLFTALPRDLAAAGIQCRTGTCRPEIVRPDIQQRTKQPPLLLFIFRHIYVSELLPLIQKHMYMLGEAADTVGGPQIRNIGTVGGNVCNGVTSADTASSQWAYNSVLELIGPEGVRQVPVSEFYTGPGKTVRRRDEVLIAILVKPEDYIGYSGCYIKYGKRRSMEIATLGCCVRVKLEAAGAERAEAEEPDGIQGSSATRREEAAGSPVLPGAGFRLADVRIGYGVAAPTPIRCRKTEQMLKGMAADDPAIYEIISTHVEEEVHPRSSWRASKEFRVQLIREMAKRALEQAKVDEEDADVSGVLRTKDEDGNPVYKVSFKSGEYSYDYIIDAVSGEVVSWEKSGFSHVESMTYAATFAEEPVTETEAAAIAETPAAEAVEVPAISAAPVPAKIKITEERAKEIAYEHAGVKATEVRRVTARPEFDDGLECYDVDFMTADGRYEYKIEAYTGEILEFEQER